MFLVYKILLNARVSPNIKKNKTKANKQLAAGKTVKSGVNEASGFLLQREKLLMSC
jgi:hypothetical protein